MTGQLELVAAPEAPAGPPRCRHCGALHTPPAPHVHYCGTCHQELADDLKVTPWPLAVRLHEDRRRPARRAA